jgi:putative endopeptidase
MEPETKKKALMKLDVLDVQVGYPDEWLNYSMLEVNNDSYVMNVLRASKFKFHHGFNGLDKIGKPVDRKLWEMNPQETNAYVDFNKVLVAFSPRAFFSLHYLTRTLTMQSTTVPSVPL